MQPRLDGHRQHTADQGGCDTPEPASFGLDSAERHTAAEPGTDSKTPLPALLDLLGICDIETYDPVAQWTRTNQAESLRIPIGYVYNDTTVLPEISFLDFTRDGWHVAIQGIIGSGVSRFTQSMLLALTTLYGPERVSLLEASALGVCPGHEFGPLPHALHTGFDDSIGLENMVEQVMDMALQEVQRRIQLLDDVQAHDSSSYRRRRYTETTLPAMPDLIVMLHDFNDDIMRMFPQLRTQLLTIIQAGPRTGVHLMLANHSFKGPRPEEILHHLPIRFSFRVHSPEESQALVDTAAAVYIPHSRAIRKLPSDFTPTLIEPFSTEVAADGSTYATFTDTGARTPTVAEAVLAKLASTQLSVQEAPELIE